MYAQLDADRLILNVLTEGAIEKILAQINTVARSEGYWVRPEVIEHTDDDLWLVEMSLFAIRKQLELKLGRSNLMQRLMNIIGSIHTSGTRLTSSDRKLVRVLLQNTDGQMKIGNQVHTLTSTNDGRHPDGYGPVTTTPTAGAETSKTEDASSQNQDATPITDCLEVLRVDTKRRNIYARRLDAQGDIILRIESDDWLAGLNQLLPAVVPLRYRASPSAHGTTYTLDGMWFRAGMRRIRLALTKARLAARVKGLLK